MFKMVYCIAGKFGWSFNLLIGVKIAKLILIPLSAGCDNCTCMLYQCFLTGNLSHIYNGYV